MGVMGITQHNRGIVSLLALTFAVATSSLSAAAQSGSEAVVCVGSETRTLATNPIRRVFTEDMEVVYRTGVDIGERDQIERTLTSELGSFPEVWCAWSDPGDDHAVIISYTGVIRQDLTVDPEDPRFQAFSVGFGTDFDAAETQATTISQRFSSYNDGSGFEVLLRQTWRVAEARPAIPEGEIYEGVASSEGLWMEISNQPGCYLWNPVPVDDETANWSGECSEGFAQGDGRIDWYQHGALDAISETRFRDGRRDGPTVFRSADGTLEAEGPYVNGQRHGTWTHVYDDGSRGVGPFANDQLHGIWTYLDENGTELGTQRFENGRRVGGFEGPATLASHGDGFTISKE